MMEHPPHQIGFDGMPLTRTTQFTDKELKDIAMVNLIEGQKYLLDGTPSVVVTLTSSGIGGVSCIRYKDGELDIIHNRRLSPAPQIGVMPTTPECNGKILQARLDSRITIQTQNLDEGRAILAKIGHLIENSILHTTDVDFRPKDTTDLMDLAKLLEVPKAPAQNNAPIVEWPENDAAAAAYAQQTMYSIDLATQMAWLEGLSVVSECTGQRHCEVMDMANHNARIKYDPIGRPAIRQHLIEKYCLDLHWLAEGECVVSIFGDHSWSSRDFGCCLGSAIVSTIINAQKAK